MEANSVFIPSCASGGAFASKQCQQGGQCWCVDPAGRELPGTQQHGDSLTCSECLSSVSKFFLHFFSFVSQFLHLSSELLMPYLVYLFSSSRFRSS